MRYLGAVAIVVVCTASAAADDRVDVNVGVDVNIHLIPPPPPPPPRADPMRAWMAVTGTYGYDETGFRVQLDLRRGLLGHGANGNAIYGVVGVAGSRGYATTSDFNSGDHLAVTDDRATGYAGIGGRAGRLEARAFIGAGVERTVGTLHAEDGLMFPAERVAPVCELGGEIFVRIVGRAGLMFGGRVTGHFEKFQADEAAPDVPAWWRVPGFESYAGIAMLTQ